jgi:translation initiation factor 5
VKTNIFNIEDVADHLRVPSIAIMKYLCSELGANMEQTSIIKGQHKYDTMLKQLDKFIDKFVLCKGCHYPELKMFVEGKDLKSTCNSCGKTNNHNSQDKAGKAFINYLKLGGATTVDITQKDKVQHEAAEDSGEEIKKGKKDKDNKKSKKKKDGGSDEEEKTAEDLSDLEEEMTWTSKRTGKL